MAIYSYEGLSIQIIDETKRPQKPSPLPLYDNEGNRTGESPSIEMKQPRPSPDHIAGISGDWALPEPTTEQSDEVQNDQGAQPQNAT